VLLYVGRFTAVKHLDLLITAYNRARLAFAVPAPLILLGGVPGEWEGEHPLETIQRTRARNVFLAGWHDHDELPDIFAAQQISGSKEMRLDRANGQREDLGHLFIGPVLQVAEDQNDTILRGQLGEMFAHQRLQVISLYRLLYPFSFSPSAKICSACMTVCRTCSRFRRSSCCKPQW
jgi:hypothetical protein